MDHETKITYSVIAVLILLLGGLAYFLQPMGGDAPKEANQVTTTDNNKPLTTTQPPKATTTTNTMDQKIYSSATITTNKGVIEIAFGTETPLTVKNFGTLASSKFYDGIRFHRVIKGFMIQTGDPLSKDIANQAAWGTGGPGYKFNDELTGKEQYPQGTVAMANSGPNTNGSQFFIVTANPGAPLPPSYTVFGKVTKGMETALAIENVKTGASDRPVEDVIIEKLEVK
jgi:peptidylprolyl isomerase